MRLVTIFLFSIFLYSSLFASEHSRIKNNEIVVKFSPQQLAQIDIERALSEGLTGVATLDALRETYQIKSLRQRFPLAKLKDIYGEPMNLRGWFKIRFSDSINVANAVLAYKQITGVQDAQVIGIHPFSVTPNDPNFTNGDMWYLNQGNDHDVDAPEAWDIAVGNTSVIVADLDSGFRFYHKDLGGANASVSNPQNSLGNMWTNPGEMGALASNGIDDDGNGKIDDWIGWDFVTGNPQSVNSGDDYDVEDNDPRDHNGHGTHTIGTIGAISNNGVGVASIAGGNGESGGLGNGVKVMGLRIGWTDLFGITGVVGMDFAASALIYARDEGATIASCSWGSSNTGGLGDAINYFIYGTTSPSGSEPKLGMVFKAAGNSDNEGSDYMLDRDDVIGVASTDENDVKSDFSTYGTFVDISAPGSNIYSTYHDNGDPNNDKIASLSGTSMATPCVASVAALVWSHNNALTASQVEQILYDTADDIYGIPGNSSYGGKLGVGRVNAFAAVNQADLALPVELTSFSASVSDGNAQLSWTTGSEIENLGFAVLRSSSEEEGYEKIADFEDSQELKGLGTSSFGKSYSFTDYSVLGGNTYWYKIQDVDFNGVTTEHGPVSVKINSQKDMGVDNINLPSTFSLQQNYPNPFNPTTRFELNIPKLQNETTHMQVAIYDLLGKRVKTLFSGDITAGVYTFQWNGQNENGNVLPSGMYIYSVISQEFTQANKMVLMK